MNYVAKTQVYPFILQYQQSHFGLSPTLAEIGTQFDKSKEWARLCLIMMETEGMVKITPKTPRGIIIVGGYQKPKKGKK